MRLPLSELHNQVVPVDAIWGQFAAEIRERLYAAPTIEAGFVLLERLLLERLAEAPYGLDVVQFAIGQIDRQHGALSIRALSNHIGISQNHLLTQFKRMVGVPPKELTRFYRFAHIVYSMDLSKEVDWGRIAHQFRFYDVSHLNRDLLDSVRLTTCVCAAASRAKTRIMPSMLARCQLIDFLQVHPYPIGEQTGQWALPEYQRSLFPTVCPKIYPMGVCRLLLMALKPR